MIVIPDPLEHEIPTPEELLFNVEESKDLII